MLYNIEQIVKEEYGLDAGIEKRLKTISGLGGRFFFNDTANTEIYTLTLHDALPICDHDRELERAAEHRPYEAPHRERVVFASAVEACVRDACVGRRPRGERRLPGAQRSWISVPDRPRRQPDGDVVPDIR